MTSFATQFPVRPTTTAADVFSAVEHWITGSRHTRLTSVDFTALQADPPRPIITPDEQIDVIRARGEGRDAAAIRYTKRDEHLEWRSTIIYTCDQDSAWVGVQVQCTSLQPATELPNAKKPVVIRVLLEHLGGGEDGELAVGDAPILLAESDVPLATRLLYGAAGCWLPIVYVSRDFIGTTPIDTSDLTRKLAGMAHVVVEPSRTFSHQLRAAVASTNVYGGTIGVYWPDGAGRRTFFLGPRDTAERLAARVADEVRVALANRRPREGCTWAFVQETASHQVLAALRASGSQEIDEFTRTFDQELRAKEERLRASEAEIARLTRELQLAQRRISAAERGGMISRGREEDYYPDEVVSVILDALQDARQRVHPDSRRDHILQDILQANPRSVDIASERRDTLKRILRGMRHLTNQQQRDLEALGFQIGGDGKHHKLVYQGDERYTFTLPRSGGDGRGGLNAAADASRLFF